MSTKNNRAALFKTLLKAPWGSTVVPAIAVVTLCFGRSPDVLGGGGLPFSVAESIARAKPNERAVDYSRSTGPGGGRYNRRAVEWEFEVCDEAPSVRLLNANKRTFDLVTKCGQ